MKLKCSYCGHEYDGPMRNLVESGVMQIHPDHDLLIDGEDRIWFGDCPKCFQSFEIKNIRNAAPIIMAFTDADDSLKNPYVHFKEEFDGMYIWNYWAFDTAEEFVNKWKEILDEPTGMWYWVFYVGKCICCGAQDPDDLKDIIEPYFESVPWINTADNEVKND